MPIYFPQIQQDLEGQDLKQGNVEIGSADAFYLGDAATDGSWRLVRSGDSLLIQRLESGIWENKGAFAP